MRGMKEEMDKLRAAAADRERLSMTAQSLEDRLKERETQVRMPFCNNIKTVSCFGFFFSVLFFLSYGCFSFSIIAISISTSYGCLSVVITLFFFYKIWYTTSYGYLPIVITLIFMPKKVYH